MSEIGTARLAITVARRLCRKKKITSTTISTASTSSISTWWTDARMPVVRSESTCTSRPAGSPACSSGSWRRMLSTVEITLAPGWRCTFRMMAGVNVAPTLPASPGSLPRALAALGRPGGGSVAPTLPASPGSLPPGGRSPPWGGPAAARWPPRSRLRLVRCPEGARLGAARRRLGGPHAPGFAWFAAPGALAALGRPGGGSVAPTLPASPGSLPPGGASACLGRPGAARTPAQARSRSFSAPFTTRATSIMRTGAPFFQDTMSRL